MRLCPNCTAPTLRTLSLLRATRQRPLRCKACGALTCLPGWASLPAVLVFELCVWPGAVMAIAFGQSLIFVAMLLVPALIAWLGAALATVQQVHARHKTISFSSGEP